jgi:imidazolonepropionase-like amidohydrolase
MKTLLKADRLIDGSGAEPLTGAIVAVENGRITGIYRGEVPDSAAAGAKIMDFPGGTIMPGMIDTHVHLNLPGDGTVLEDAVREPEGVLVATSAFTAARALAGGVTTVRDLGAMRGTVFNLKRALALGHGTGARIVACGQPITITGGHTWYFGGEADGVDGLRQKVRGMVKQGADFIKVMGSGGGTVNTLSWRPSYRREEIAALADEAHALDRKIAIHCLCADSIEYAVDAGVDQIEHAGFLIDSKGNQQFDPRVAEKLAKSGIPVTGTLAVAGAAVKAMLAKENRTAAEDAFLGRWQAMLEDNVEQFRKLRDAGVSLVAGTDAGWRFTPFDGLPMEMELMVRGGMSTLEAITAGTGFAARVIGIDDKVGTLQAGLEADIIVVSGNPVEDLDRLRHLQLVMQAGHVRPHAPPPAA